MYQIMLHIKVVTCLYNCKNTGKEIIFMMRNSF